MRTLRSFESEVTAKRGHGYTRRKVETENSDTKKRGRKRDGGSVGKMGGEYLSKENERAEGDIVRCKLQFCCEIIIKYIMLSRALPLYSPHFYDHQRHHYHHLSVPQYHLRGPLCHGTTVRGAGVSLKVFSDAYS